MIPDFFLNYLNLNALTLYFHFLALVWYQETFSGILGNPVLAAHTLRAEGGLLSPFDVLYVTSLDGKLYIIEMLTGEILIRHDSASALSSGANSLLAASGGMGNGTDVIYIGSNGGVLSSVSILIIQKKEDNISALTSTYPTASGSGFPSASPFAAPVSALSRAPQQKELSSSLPTSFILSFQPTSISSLGKTDEPSVAPTLSASLSFNPPLYSSSTNGPILVTVFVIILVALIYYAYQHLRRRSAQKYSKVYLSDDEEDRIGGKLYENEVKVKPKSRDGISTPSKKDLRAYTAKSSPEIDDVTYTVDTINSPSKSSEGAYIASDNSYSSSRRKDRAVMNKLDDRDIYQVEAIRASVKSTTAKTKNLFIPISVKSSID